METIDEYRIRIMNELRFDADHEGTVPETQFINWAMEILKENGDINDPIITSVVISGWRKRKMAFDAYAYDEADNALVLVSCDFYNEIDSVTNNNLTNSRINDLCSWMQNFVDESVNGRMSEYCDDSDNALDIAREFRTKIGRSMMTSEILRFKYIIISNSLLSKQVRDVSREDFLDRPVSLNIWTLERFYQSYVSNSSEIIEFDTSEFGCQGIQYLKADIGEDADYEAYLGIVPAAFLANAYLKYGSKLLQGNVRAFLSVKGKVNKGIRETIIKCPQNFFTYNNGIAVVARSISLSEDETKIVHFRDFQIINGGQTTASLANAIIKKERVADDMANLFVPMKLTVLNVKDEMSEKEIDRYNEITQKISECANSQNAVSSADFFSNHPFHVMMEKLSLKVMAPPAFGKPFSTIWYYERSRGKWEQDQMKLTHAQKADFCSKRPKNQVLKKEKLAKCLNTFAMNPHEVCQSSAINFRRFASTIDEMYENSKDSINEAFFKKCVCKVIIFDGLDNIIKRSQWYPAGGNKAQIVPYSIAKLMSLIPKGKDLDWILIWRNQSMYNALATQLEDIARIINSFLIDEAGGEIVRSMSRRPDTWKKCKEKRIILNDDFLDSLVSVQEYKEEEKADKRQHRFNRSLSNALEIFNLGAQYWKNVYNKASAENLLPYGDLAFISSVADYTRRNCLLSDRQCFKLRKIIENLEEKGFIMP
ncbi:MAG: AIPR family protein [Porphyromonadaceae bacterium]|nr:AIPR family protein [Porphyromonadaceae bacterium]